MDDLDDLEFRAQLAELYTIEQFRENYINRHATRLYN